MTRKKIITRISNEIGNQLFMYASTYAIAKKLKRSLILDDESAFKSSKNISRYALNNFKITSEVANKKFKYLGFVGYMKRKLLKKIDFFKKKKNFFVEKKDKSKITNFNKEIYQLMLSDNLFIEGYFESEKYFLDIRNEILNEFNFLRIKDFQNSPFYQDLIKENSISICFRQNRFVEGKKKNKDTRNYFKSENFSNEQISYINTAINFFNNKINSPKFFLWSNNAKNIDLNLFKSNVSIVDHDAKFCENIDKRALDLFLISQCHHHIVVPSSFNWWGAWLSKRKNKIICRPSDNFFSDFKLNNLDFWPDTWIEINEKN